MSTQQSVHAGAAEAEPDVSIASRRPAAAARGGAAAGPRTWTSTAAGQLTAAVEIAARTPAGESIAAALYRKWFTPRVGDVEVWVRRRPLAGLFRAAHAASGIRSVDGVAVLDRHDIVGADGWWRTWGKHWTPPRSRPGSIRVLLSPRAEHRAGFVHAVTASLGASDGPWSLACATDPHRAGRYASAVLDLPGTDALPDPLLADLAALTHPVTPPLCLPIAVGIGVVAYPDNGMSFGEHRCHLIGLGLRRAGCDDPLDAIADVFTAHGVDPARPHGVD